MARTGETCRLGSAVKTIAEEATSHFVLLIHHPVRGLGDDLSEIRLAARLCYFSRLELRQSYQLIVGVAEADVRGKFEVDRVGSL